MRCKNCCKDCAVEVIRDQEMVRTRKIVVITNMDRYRFTNGGKHVMECLFCQIQQGQVPVPGGFIYEDELVCATHHFDDTKPVYLGYLVVQTKRHAATFADLTDCEARSVGLLVTRLSRALKACVGAERSYVVCFGEAVPHLHVFVTARYPDTPPEYWRSKITVWPDAPRGGPEEITALCDKLRAYLMQTA